MNAIIDVVSLGDQIARADGSLGAAYALLAPAFEGADYAKWEQIRAQFVEGAAKTHKAPQDLWDRTVRAMRGLSLIGDKPAAPTKGAAKKASSRATVKAKAEDAAAKGETHQSVFKEAAALLEAGKSREASEKTAIGLALEKRAQKAQSEAVAAAAKSAREGFEEALKAAKADGVLTGSVYRELEDVLKKHILAGAKVAAKAKPTPAAKGKAKAATKANAEI